MAEPAMATPTWGLDVRAEQADAPGRLVHRRHSGVLQRGDGLRLGPIHRSHHVMGCHRASR